MKIEIQDQYRVVATERIAFNCEDDFGAQTGVRLFKIEVIQREDESKFGANVISLVSHDDRQYLGKAVRFNSVEAAIEEAIVEIKKQLDQGR